MKRVQLYTKVAIGAVISSLMIALLAPNLGSSAFAQTEEQVEPLYGFEFATAEPGTHEEGGLSVTVRSTGCTKAGDFSFAKLNNDWQLIRHKPDRCRKKPFLHTISLPLPPGAGGGELLNPLFLSLR